MFRRYQRADQTLRGTSLSNNHSTPPTNAAQEYNDVKDKLDDLIPWLKKLLDTLAKVNPDDDREEVERRSQLTKCVSCPEFSSTKN